MNACVKIVFCLLVLLISNSGPLLAQSRITARIVDAKTNEGLPFAHVRYRNKAGGTIANEAGYFDLTVANHDSIEISYLGYFMVVLPAGEMPPVVKLNADSQLIEDVVVYADDDYLYDWIDRCRTSLKKRPKEERAKAYLVVTTQCNGVPVEMIECYYNARLTQYGIDSLSFKNGRSQLRTHNYGGYFLNFDLSRSLSMYSLIDGHYQFPDNPFQYRKAKIKKLFKLDRGRSVGKALVIRFSPRNPTDHLFSGEITLDRETFHLIDLELKAPPGPQKVFRPMGNSVLDSIQYSCNFHYTQVNNSAQLSHISIDYEAWLTSKHNMDSIFREEVKLKAISHAVLHLYNHGSQFDIPIFNYAHDISDYRMLVVPPPDARSWSCLQADNHIRLTPDQSVLKTFMLQNAEAFTDTFVTNKFFFDSNYHAWSPTRWFLIKKMNKIEETTGFRRFQQEDPFLTDRLKLTVQIFMDINLDSAGYFFTTRTLLDTYHSFNYLEINPALQEYVNIYMDLAELHRRQLQVALQNMNDIDTAIHLHQTTVRAMAAEHARFEKEAFGGLNEKAMEPWRKRVEGLRIGHK